jgi:hypothetical protein
MTARNYDTTNSRPYPRVTKIEILYPSNGVPQITYVEQMAIVDGDGAVQHLSQGATAHVLDLSLIPQPVQVVHPDTDAQIPGLTVTVDDAELHLLAFLRADQKRRDAL